jgi:hypothetical protein
LSSSFTSVCLPEDHSSAAFEYADLSQPAVLNVTSNSQASATLVAMR